MIDESGAKARSDVPAQMRPRSTAWALKKTRAQYGECVQVPSRARRPDLYARSRVSCW